MIGCLPSSSTVSPHPDGVNLVMHSKAITVRTWRPQSSDFGDTLGGCDCHSAGYE